MASTVDLPFLNPNSFTSFLIVSNRHIGLQDEDSSKGLLPFLSRTKLCFFQSSKKLPSRRQELKASRRISGSRDHLFDDLVWNPVDPRRRIRLKPHTRSLYFFKSEELFAPDHVGSSVMSLEWLYVWKQASHNVFDSIEIVQIWGLLVTKL